MDEAGRVGAAVERVRRVPRFAIRGRVTRIIGPVVEVSPLHAAIGELCLIEADGQPPLEAEVVGFHDRGILLMTLGTPAGIYPGAPVRPLKQTLDVPVGQKLIGRILDGLGRPLDGRPLVGLEERRPLAANPPHPLERETISTPLSTGIRALDGLLTLGRGQRIGIFAGSGVGKSVLLGMIARHTSADVNVIALLGERGREVREFLERDLGPAGLRRSVVIVATGDQPALIRAKGALVATAIAEYFRDRGGHVLLMMDSITRVAMALREIGLSVGEPPTTKGYPPSVFAALPRLLERAGSSRTGSISGLYTVLVEGDDFNEPVADAARSILDGHITLSRRLASLAHFPAVVILDSVSRVRDLVIDDAHREAIHQLLRLEAAHRAHEDLLAVGAYQKGSNRDVDAAVALREPMLAFLRQRPDDASSFEQARTQVLQLANQARDLVLRSSS